MQSSIKSIKNLAPFIDLKGDGPQTSEYTKPKGTRDREVEGEKGSLWLLANWQKEQNCSVAELNLKLQFERTLLTIGKDG